LKTDYLRAELNLLFQLNQLTLPKVNSEPIVLRLTDQQIFDNPFLFMSDVGRQCLSHCERGNLWQHLESRGFLWTDEFADNAE